MTLASGTRLGPYEVRGALGAGGMGEVYRAHDTKLKREVAVKVLPEAFARDEERMKRFEREAQVLASLNHPNIASIYGLEEADGVRALVLELVEGPTLAERIAAGPMPLEEAVRIAIQITHGLEAAHEKAVIHRDLKPANVKLTKDGDVKILDFGLAKALEGESARVDDAQSPTLTRAATHAGVLLGTAAYMSPEQAKGKPADRRADVWAFGVVLFEMLTARRAFAGEDVSETLAAVLTRGPDWSALPAGVPARVRGLLARCLTRDPRQRLQAIGEARIALEGAAGAGPEADALPARRTSVLWPVLAGVASMALGVTLWALWPRPAPNPLPPVRLSVELGAEATVVAGDLGMGAAAVLSPDASLLAFVAAKGPASPTQLYLRRLADLEASPLSGTQGARNPFFSPDGQWIAFFAERRLKKVAVAGGAVVTLCEARDDRGGSWGVDGTIVLAPFGQGGLFRVEASGGTPEVLTRPDPGTGEVHRWPQILPGGRAVLYTAGIRGYFDDATIVVQTLSGGPAKVLTQGGYHGRYLPSGHLAYIREGTLFAAAFDLDRLELSGPPAPVLEDVASYPGHGGAQFAHSDRGTLVYLHGESTGAVSLYWTGGAGSPQLLPGLPSDPASPRFSPDGQRLAMDVREGSQRDIWVYAWERETLSRLTFDPTDDTRPVWHPAGRRIAFASRRADKGTPNLYWQPADGSGPAERLTTSRNMQYPASWHPSGGFLAFQEYDPQTSSYDVKVLEVTGNEASGFKPEEPTAFLNTPFVESNPAFSPDGRWLAYQSDDSGSPEVYVRSFPGPGGGRWQVSVGGGSSPTWSSTRHEILYRGVGQGILVAGYTMDGDSFRPERPRAWSEGNFRARPDLRDFDLHPDGRRVVVRRAPPGQSEKPQDSVVFVLNFFDHLRRVAPVQGAK